MARHDNSLTRPVKTAHFSLRSQLVTCWLILMFSFSPFIPAATAQSVLYEVMVSVLKFPAAIESPEALLESLVTDSTGQWNRTGVPIANENVNSVLLFPVPVQAPEFPWLAESAIADYREALRQDFIERTGRPDGLMAMSDLVSLASRKRLPSSANAVDYLAIHDRDRDNRLTIEEFTPAADEIARTVDLKALVSCFTRGLPYPTGQLPMASATVFGLAPVEAGLFTTAAEIEQRIEAYASSISGSTYRRPDGRLGAKDANGMPVQPLPEDVVPPHKLDAEARLQRYAADTGGTVEFFPNQPAALRDSSGIAIPMQQWPPFTQPPYHPEEGPP